MNDQVILKPIPGYEGLYEVSNTGRVFSCKRIVKGQKNSSHIVERSERALTPDKKGYLTVPLSKNNISKTFKVHRLVALAFIPNPQNKPQVNHIDGNKQNNNLSNLEWVNNTENVLHSYKIGLQIGLKGANNPSAKLNELDVYVIKKLHKRGKFSYRKLSKMFGVTTTTIGRIVKNKGWSRDTKERISRIEQLLNLYSPTLTIGNIAK